MPPQPFGKPNVLIDSSRPLPFSSKNESTHFVENYETIYCILVKDLIITIVIIKAEGKEISCNISFIFLSENFSNLYSLEEILVCPFFVNQTSIHRNP